MEENVRVSLVNNIKLFMKVETHHKYGFLSNDNSNPINNLTSQYIKFLGR